MNHQILEAFRRDQESTSSSVAFQAACERHVVGATQPVKTRRGSGHARQVARLIAQRSAPKAAIEHDRCARLCGLRPQLVEREAQPLHRFEVELVRGAVGEQAQVQLVEREAHGRLTLRQRFGERSFAGSEVAADEMHGRHVSRVAQLLGLVTQATVARLGERFWVVALPLVASGVRSGIACAGLFAEGGAAHR